MLFRLEFSRPHTGLFSAPNLFSSINQRLIVRSQRGTQVNARQATVVDIASVHDNLWALIRQPDAEGPRLACYFPHLNVWDAGYELPSDVHRVLESSFSKTFGGLYLLKKNGILLQVPALVGYFPFISLKAKSSRSLTRWESK